MNVILRRNRSARKSVADRLRERAGIGRAARFLRREFQDWRQTRTWLRQLSEADARQAALDDLARRGPKAWRGLYRALNGAVGPACLSADALWRLGQTEGVRILLRRAYEEEWLLGAGPDRRLDALRALRRLESEAVRQTFRRALDAAGFERDPRACLEHLTLALSAIRVLRIFDAPTPLTDWLRALHFGTASLRGLTYPSSRLPASTLASALRALALRGLLTEYPRQSFDALRDALHSADMSVCRTALLGLQRLGDPRALPLLQPIAVTRGHPLVTQARYAIERLAGPEADVLALLRAGRPESEPDSLLRPAEPTARRAEEARALLRSA